MNLIVGVGVGVAINSHSYHRDGEAAYVSLNGVICWLATMTASQGTEQCGGQSRSAPWNEDAVPVTGCSVTLSGSGMQPLAVRVWTNLDSTKDESFGISNFAIDVKPPTTPTPITKGARMGYVFSMCSGTHCSTNTCG